jgi:hypothetical protein
MMRIGLRGAFTVAALSLVAAGASRARAGDETLVTRLPNNSRI